MTLHPSVADALEAAGSADPGEFEIEEFLDGPIIHVDGVMEGGALVAVQASRYIGTCLGYAQGQPFGSVQIETDSRVIEWTHHCLRAIGINNGPFHLEGIEATDGLVFLEVGARFGGADVVDTFALATGVHLPSAQIRLLVEGRTGIQEARIPDRDALYGWFVFPGHHIGSQYCIVKGGDRFREDPLVRRWVQRATDEPVKPTVTYADSDVPLAGVVGPAPAPELETLLTSMFASITVEPLW
ncbi:hypothetical protein RIF23_20065 [Lipingzhangella sp. LS1_29]|uniref:ATP-grasp domain-containing protein n=1 Tax=Lipingzhangella rawalii TaxID=2055835 RepID=A0ABU2HB92_9ACTN|nr:hypothetical protein [Lipingzhangella rawalii]MDS1272588.1 hypothetical protein [Lipingzhangella rawalii]